MRLANTVRCPILIAAFTPKHELTLETQVLNNSMTVAKVRRLEYAQRNTINFMRVVKIQDRDVVKTRGVCDVCINEIFLIPWNSGGLWSLENLQSGQSWQVSASPCCDFVWLGADFSLRRCTSCGESGNGVGFCPKLFGFTPANHSNIAPYHLPSSPHPRRCAISPDQASRYNVQGLSAGDWQRTWLVTA
jgi:hypothetical protein